MVEVTQIDFDVFFRLTSMYRALATSVTSSVSVPSGLDKPGRISTFSHIFYDCADDERTALKLMRERVRLFSNDISEHLRLHREMLKCFYDIEEAANASNRGRVSASALGLCRSANGYSRLVFEHISNAGGKRFLLYPTCVPGHYLIIPGQDTVAMLSFNPDQSGEGFIMDVCDLERRLNDFRVQPERIGVTRVSDIHDTGEGIMDVSLRGRLELTAELLRRVGYNC